MKFPAQVTGSSLAEIVKIENTLVTAISTLNESQTKKRKENEDPTSGAVRGRLMCDNLFIIKS